MLCQTCSAFNDDDREFCFRCQNKLLVLSGVTAFEEDEIEDYEEQEDLSLDEHLLERVSGLEEIVKRTAETLRSAVEAVQKHERAIFVNQTGLLSVKELLEKKNIVSADELVCTYTQNGLDRLALFQVSTQRLTPIDLPYTHYSYLRACGNRVAFRAGSATEPASIVVLDLATRTTQVLARATSVAANPQLNRYFSQPQPIEFPTDIQLVINLDTAKALNIAISREMQLRADEVIE